MLSSGRLGFLLLAIWIDFLSCVASADRKLIQTNLVYRHGDRSPVAIYPSDTHQESAWPDGLGELTQVGKEQQTELGKFLRNRYKHLLSDKFNPKEIYVRSSPMDRTLMSAYSNLAGLYDNHTDVKWSGKFISWQPIPVHTVALNTDELLKMDRPCKTVDSRPQSSKVKKLMSDLSSLRSLLMEKTGYPSNLTTEQMSHVRDTLFCERCHHLKWPAWANSTNITCPAGAAVSCKNRPVFDILSDVDDILYVYTVNDGLYRKFRGGPLLMKMIDNMQSRIKGETNTTFYMYSAHDSTVAALLGAMRTFNNRSPQYTATVMLELYARGDEYEVEANYKKVTGSDKVTPLEIPGCDTPCSFSQFVSLYEDLKIDDWDTACDNDSAGTTGLSQGAISAIIFCTLLILASIITTLLCCIKRKRYNPYTPVPT